MGMNINKIMPWFVTLAAIGMWILLATSFILRPFTVYDIVPATVIAVCLIVLVRSYFKIYAVFERMDQRDREMGIWK